MYEFEIFIELEMFDLFLDKIFQGLHIVIGLNFLVLDPLRIVKAKVCIELPKSGKYCLINTAELWQRDFTQCYEILHFNEKSIFDQSKFRKVRCQVGYTFSIPSIYRRD